MTSHPLAHKNHMSDGNWLQAISSINEMVHFDGWTVELAIDASVCYIKLGRYERAFEITSDLISEHTRNLELCVEFTKSSMLLKDMQKIEDACRILERISSGKDISFLHIFFLEQYHNARKDGLLSFSHFVISKAKALFPENIKVLSEYVFSDEVKDKADCSAKGLYDFYSSPDSRCISLEEQKVVFKKIFVNDNLAPIHRLNCAIALAYKAIETNDEISAEEVLIFLSEMDSLLLVIPASNNIRFDRRSLYVSRCTAMWHIFIFLDRSLEFARILTDLERYFDQDVVSMDDDAYFQSGNGFTRMFALLFCDRLWASDLLEAERYAKKTIKSLQRTFYCWNDNIDLLMFQEYTHFIELGRRITDWLSKFRVSDEHDDIEHIVKDIFSFIHHISYERTPDVCEDFCNRYTSLIKNGFCHRSTGHA